MCGNYESHTDDGDSRHSLHILNIFKKNRLSANFLVHFLMTIPNIVTLDILPGGQGRSVEARGRALTLDVLEEEKELEPQVFESVGVQIYEVKKEVTEEEEEIGEEEGKDKMEEQDERVEEEGEAEELRQDKELEEEMEEVEV